MTSLPGVVVRYCQVCHNEFLQTGNLSLAGFDVATAASMPETAEKMIQKLRAEMMPPPGIPRPAGDTPRASGGDPRIQHGPGGRACPQPRGDAPFRG